jgi:hypothetical protein
VLPEEAKEIRKRGRTKVCVIISSTKALLYILPINLSAHLRIHMMHKQYKCAFCRSRFKNKNEAERHQSPLHLRRHSWSCAAISGYEAAFALLTSQNDTYGYCGTEFSNFPCDWDARIEHLTKIHKLGECNQIKKFFRADHFRQHLRHSHAGLSGKWTNILENACMKDEPAAEVSVGTTSETRELSQQPSKRPTALPTQSATEGSQPK